MPPFDRRSSSVAIVALAILTGMASVARAQNVRGTVSARDGGGTLPYAVVSLRPLAKGRTTERPIERFANERGAFAISDVQPGPYRLRVRQLGFTPLDTVIAVAASEAEAPLQLQLTRIAVQLSAVQVLVRRTCTHPGVPDSTSSPELYAIFDQLRQNAERYVLLADQYPFRYSLERSYGWSGGEGSTRMGQKDTVVVSSDVRWRYSPGHVVSRVRGLTGGEYEVTLPTLPDFADPTFQRNHCFEFAGTEATGDARYVRVAFKASAKLKSPDVHGWVRLDPTTYQVRQATITLTKIPRGWSTNQIAGVTATTWFREIVPSIVIVDSVSASNAFRKATRDGTAQATETHRLVNFAFTRTGLGPGH
jgi:hypothetical protein